MGGAFAADFADHLSFRSHLQIIFFQDGAEALGLPVGSATGKISSWQIVVDNAAKVAEAKVSADEAEKQLAAKEEMPYVKNGSRDRWGNLRKNVGGRPRKIVTDQNQKQISPKKSIGNQKQKIEEFRLR